MQGLHPTVGHVSLEGILRLATDTMWLLGRSEPLGLSISSTLRPELPEPTWQGTMAGAPMPSTPIHKVLACVRSEGQQRRRTN